MEETKAKLREVLPRGTPDSLLDELLKQSNGDIQIAVELFYHPATVQTPQDTFTQSSSARQQPPSQPHGNPRFFRQPNVQAENGSPASGKPPKDTEFYDILEISFTATPAEIKKAYYKAAMLCHPDKHPGDPMAEERFKQVAQAYQVLSDPNLKAKYDQYGKEATQGEGANMDPKEFFNRIFGGGKFEDFIGELSLLTVDNENMTEEMREKSRMERTVKLYSLMVVMLQPVVEGRPKDFERSMTGLAEDLKEESFGYEMLRALGYIYDQKSRQYLGLQKFLGLAGRYHGAKEKFHLMSEAISTVSAAVDLQRTVEVAHKKETAGTLNEAEKAEFERNMAAKGIHAMWRLNKLDIEATIRGVCDMVMRDPAVSKPIRVKRAEGLKLLGRIFLNVKGHPTPLDHIM